MPREPVALDLPMARSATVLSLAGCGALRAVARSCCDPAVFWSADRAGSLSRTGGSGSSPAEDGTFARRMPKAIDATNTISRFPHTRRGLVPHQIEQTEIGSHLNEARAIKGVPPEDASLIAVFRSVPVELISHLRFDESRMLLLFRLVPSKGRCLTHVYDLAAVKDMSTGRLHLIPHRTRNRTVMLS